MPDSCECTRRVGCCCSECLSPDSITELISGDPWEVGFDFDGPILVSFESGDGSISIPIIIYPTDGLIYTQIEWETDQDWPDGSIWIEDEDGNVVQPWDWNLLDPDGTPFTVNFDPALFDPGMYDGKIKTIRCPTPDDCTDGEEKDKDVRVEVEEPTGLAVSFIYQPGMTVMAQAAGSEKYGSFGVRRSKGTDNAYWKLEWAPVGWPGGSTTFSFSGDGAALNFGTVYGPLTTSANQWLVVEVDPTSMVGANSPYLGTLTLTGYRDAGGTEVTNTETFYINTQIIAYPNGGDFIVTTPGSIERGVPFDITIRAIDPDDGTTEEDYEGGSLNINLTSFYSPPDSVTPTEYESAGLWVDGILTITGLVYTGGAGSETPLLQIFDHATRYNGFLLENVAPAGIGFDLTMTPNVTRGVATNLVIQAVDINGENDTAYVPATTCTIALTSSDGGDAILPVSTDATGWVNGKKTVSVTINGGAGSDSYEVEVTDDTTGQSGTVTGAIAPSTVTRSIVAFQGFYGVGIGGLPPPNETDDWDGAAAALEAQAWPDTLIDFDADSSIGVITRIQSSYLDTYDYVLARGQIYGGYAKFTVTAGDKALALKSVKMKGYFYATEGGWNSGTGLNVPFTGLSWDRYAHERELQIFFSESAASFANGGALRTGITPDITLSYNKLNNDTIALGGVPGALVRIFIDIPTTVISNLVGNDLYVWMINSVNSDYGWLSGFNKSISAVNVWKGGFQEIGIAEDLVLYY